MALTAKTVLLNAITILQDGSSVRWPLSELRRWLNAGLKEMANLKPTATSATEAIDLASGTQQTLPSDVALLLRPVRNASGPVVTTIDRAILDSQIPGWHEASTVPYSSICRHVMQDPMDPEVFHVFPGNDGTGQIVCVVSKQPPEIAAPTDEFDIEEYDTALGVSDLYENALVDYILYRAFSKDMQMAGSGERATAHYTQFKQSLMDRGQIEGMANINSAGATGS
jgi:hypothetical protein